MKSLRPLVAYAWRPAWALLISASVTKHEWVSLVAVGGHLALAGLVALRRTRSPLAVPLALLCLDLAAWNVADLVFEISGNPLWARVDVLFSPFTPALALHVVVVFVGRRHDLRRALAGVYALFTTFALASNIGAIHRVWDYGLAAAALAAVAWALTLLVRHLRTVEDDAERARTRGVIAAFAIGGLLGPTELIGGFTRIPPIGNLGVLLSTALIAAVTLRFQLLGREVSVGVALYSLSLALLVVLGGVAIVRWAGAGTALATLAAVTFGLALLAATRELIVGYGVDRERQARLATLGRFSSQLAHDLRNPIGALKGALQFLEEESAQGRRLDDHAELVHLMLDQVDRLQRVVDDYQRIGRVEPRLTPTRVNDVVRSVLSLDTAGRGSSVSIRTDLDEALVEIPLDRDLLAAAIENVIRNSIEAMPTGGSVTVRTASIGGIDGGTLLAIEDTGEGMDARVVDQASSDFFSTKARGSGLGLAFVRRVVHAHGGRVTIASRIGEGTTVRIVLPAPRDPQVARA